MLYNLTPWTREWKNKKKKQKIIRNQRRQEKNPSKEGNRSILIFMLNLERNTVGFLCLSHFPFSRNLFPSSPFVRQLRKYSLTSSSSLNVKDTRQEKPPGKQAFSPSGTRKEKIAKGFIVKATFYNRTRFARETPEVSKLSTISRTVKK